MRLISYNNKILVNLNLMGICEYYLVIHCRLTLCLINFFIFPWKDSIMPFFWSFDLKNGKYSNDLSDCNGTRTRNPLIRKQTLNHLAKLVSLVTWLNVRLQTKWLSVRVPLQTLKIQISRLFQAKQGVPWHSGNCRVWVPFKTRT